MITMSTLSPPPPTTAKAPPSPDTPPVVTTTTSDGRVLNDAAYREQSFPALRLARVGRYIRRLAQVLLGVLFLSVLAAFFVPWQQSINGAGAVIAFDPMERPQTVKAPIKGIVAERGPGVQENAYVKQGQLLFRLQDQDPFLLERLQGQVTNAETELRAAKDRLEQSIAYRETLKSVVAATTESLASLENARDEIIRANDGYVEQATAKIDVAKAKLSEAEAAEFAARKDYERKKELFAEGYESELKFQEVEQKNKEAFAKLDQAIRNVQIAKQGLAIKERERESKRQEWQSKIQKVQSELQKETAAINDAEQKINKTLEEIAKKETDLLDKKSKVSKQQTQDVLAPRDGYVMKLQVVTNLPVKEGDQLCQIVPKTENPAAQIWVAGNDAPLIHAGDHVRLQFEGWPAIQFSGWPSVAVGTFGGTVALVDPTDNGAGRFRVVVVPDENDVNDWPEYPYLRQGVRTKGWVLLEQVPLGYEVWRRMNGFPPAIDMQKDTMPKPPKIKI